MYDSIRQRRPFIMKRPFAILLLTMILTAGAAFPAVPPAGAAGLIVSGEATSSTLVTSDGRTRTYRVYVPASYASDSAMPLMIVFHGGFGSGEQVARQTGFDVLAEREGFIAVYPDGATAPNREVIPTWNAGDCCGYAKSAAVDDVAFVRELLDEIEARLSIDPTRVYATGMSNGGMFSYRLACDLADRIAAVAPVAGSIALGDCSPARSIPILAFHGEADESVPYAGGPVMRTGDIVPAALDLAATWAGLNACELIPVTTDESGYTTTTYSSCDAGVTVTLYSIPGFGHAWPGSTGGAIHSGEMSPVDASELIWKELSTYRL